ncbi:rhodanese-like domain-containing protein [Caulobacter sp. 17J80-11]|uniref:rhodanese-like domain-containing protein n=1 Tax=Caulobacter sp. 17J80-11 TaxID=2763502 RepID=UPI001653B1B8|nr:rhodanese-like domain-containing protein [Caulobacter sp. 17J80-11]MBC6982262.1 rhodanese-like domain-containing protein [Caulobacter sp. 17J80-11]
MVKSITREELKRRLDAGEPVRLIEALPEKYFVHAHLPGAVRLNYDEVTDRAAVVLPDRGAPIIVYCASDTCANSHKTAEALTALGYADVAVYPGGKKDWTEAGLAVVSEREPA